MILTSCCLMELMQLHKLQKPHALLFPWNNSLTLDSGGSRVLAALQIQVQVWIQAVQTPRASQVMLVVKNPSANAGDIRDLGSIPGSGRSPRGEHGNPLQYSCLENPMGRGAWRATVHGVTKSCIRLKWLSTQSRPHHDNHNFRLLNDCHGSSSNPGILTCMSLFSPHYSPVETGFCHLIFPEGKLRFERLPEATLWTEAWGSVSASQLTWPRHLRSV